MHRASTLICLGFRLSFAWAVTALTATTASAEYSIAWDQVASFPTSLPASYVGDMDGDGTMELVVAAYEGAGAFRLQIRDAATGIVEFQLPYTTASKTVWSVYVMDYDADSRAEALCIRSDVGAGEMFLIEWSPVLGVAPTDPAEHSRSLHVRSNPARGSLQYEVDASVVGPVEIEMMDVMGRRVFGESIPAGPRPEARPGSVSLRDDRGKPVVPGQYFLKLRRGTETIASQKVTVLR